MGTTRKKYFTKFFENAIFDKRLSLSLPGRLRKRIWHFLMEYDEHFNVQRDLNNSYIDQTSISIEIIPELFKLYGIDQLEISAYNGRKKVDLKGFIEGTYPSNIFDVIQYWYDQLAPDRQQRFQNELNDILEEEGCSWRFYDRDFIQIDSKFLEEIVLKKTQELLEEKHFLGPMEEFKEARNDLISGDFKGAILNSCKAYESVLKILLERKEGTAKQLIDGLIGEGIIDEIPHELHTQFSEKIFQSVPYIRNKLAGHGQGEEIISVSKEIAELCLNFSGALIVFFIHNKKSLNSKDVSCKTDKF